jgi:hypothetical protein
MQSNRRVEMNYLKVYCNLIREAECRDAPEGYTEKHHIFPVSIYGNNNKVVVLTAREHYIAHALLEKIFIKRYGENDRRSIKMIHAFYCMNSANKKKYYNSYLYESSKDNLIKIMKNRKPVDNVGKWNIGKIRSEETKEKIRQKRMQQVFTEEMNQKRKDTIKKLCWLHHPITKKNCRILPEKIQDKLNEGYVMGRYYVPSEEARRKLSEKTTLQWKNNPPRKRN